MASRLFPLLLSGLTLAACSSGTGDSDSGNAPVGPPDEAPLERLSKLIRSDEASKLAIRVWIPDAERIAGDPWPRMTGLLESVTDKPGGITVELMEAPLPDRDWTDQALERNLDLLWSPPPDDTAVIDVLAVHGTYSESTHTVLGLGWSWQRIAVFIDPLTEACEAAAGGGATGSPHGRVCEATWAAILRHETGHVLGLVDNELPMVADHEDPMHPHHDPDPDCLMYYAWDRSELSGKVADQDLELCAGSLADLAAFRDAN